MVIVVLKKRFCLSGFFVILILSMGLASVNPPLSSNTAAYATSSALSRGDDGDDTAEQRISQSNSSTRDDEENDKATEKKTGKSKSTSQENAGSNDESASDPNYQTATLKITTVQRANCNHHPCPFNDGKVAISSPYAGIEKQFNPDTGTPGGTAHYEIELPVDQSYVIAASGYYKLDWIWTFEGANIVSDKDSCSAWRTTCQAVMPADGAAVTVNFHYKCNDSSC